MTALRPTGKVRLSIRPSRPAVARVGGGVHLLVRVEPPAPPARPDRRPVALALVIDRSGSMGGPAAEPGTPGIAPASRGARDTGVADKLSFVKAATRRLLDLMHDGDAVALVTFDDAVSVVKPLTVLDDRARPAIASAVRRLQPGGSTNLEGGLRAGLEQLCGRAQERYGCKLVLLSDGEANVGERRPAVLAEVAAGAAHDGVTTSTLGVGFEYNIALMTALAEAGNGDFSHIDALQALDDILREEFTSAAEVTARAVDVLVDLPERVAVGTNLNGYRQDSTEAGFKVSIGDLVRPKEFIFEMTTPVPLEGEELALRARAAYRDVEDVARECEARLRLRVCTAQEAIAAPVDEEVIARLLTQLPAQAEMDTVLAYEAGDYRGASSAVDSSRRALDDVERLYGPAAAMRPELGTWRARLMRLSEGASTRTFAAADLKTMYAAGHDLSRSRPVRPIRPEDLMR
jgi:Ca-activated chloride channel family protein